VVINISIAKTSLSVSEKSIKTIRRIAFLKPVVIGLVSCNKITYKQCEIEGGNYTIMKSVNNTFV
jgi:hypothetical protein